MKFFVDYLGGDIGDFTKGSEVKYCNQLLIFCVPGYYGVLYLTQLIITVFILYLFEGF